MDSAELLSRLAKRYEELGHWVEVDEHWLNRWTAAVVIGVALELWVIWRDHVSEWHNFRRGTIRSPERPSRPKLMMELLSTLPVIVGVAGEFFIARSSGEKETEMRAISGKQVSIAEGDAAAANIEAGDARKEAGYAVERASKADERAAKNEKEAARLRLRSAELEELYSLRRIDRLRLRESVKPYATSEAVEIVIRGQTTDALLTSVNIEGAFVEAGWRVRSVNGASVNNTGNFLLGIMVLYAANSTPSTLMASKAIRDELDRQGVFVTLVPYPSQLGSFGAVQFSGPRQWRWEPTTIPTIRVDVGDKPPFKTTPTGK